MMLIDKDDFHYADNNYHDDDGIIRATVRIIVRENSRPHFDYIYGLTLPFFPQTLL